MSKRRRRSRGLRGTSHQTAFAKAAKACGRFAGRKIHGACMRHHIRKNKG